MRRRRVRRAERQPRDNRQEGVGISGGRQLGTPTQRGHLTGKRQRPMVGANTRHGGGNSAKRLRQTTRTKTNETEQQSSFIHIGGGREQEPKWQPDIAMVMQPHCRTANDHCNVRSRLGTASPRCESLMRDLPCMPSM